MGLHTGYNHVYLISSVLSLFSPLSLSLLNRHRHTHTHTLSHAHTGYNVYLISPTLSLPSYPLLTTLYLSPSFRQTQTHTLSLSLSLTHTHTHTHTHGAPHRI